MGYLTVFISQNICRLCLREDRVLLPIFGDVPGMKSVDEIINLILPFKVYKNDLLPDKICADCFYELKISYDFYRVSERSYQTLRSYLLTEKQDKNGSPNLESPACTRDEDESSITKSNVPHKKVDAPCDGPKQVKPILSSALCNKDSTSAELHGLPVEKNVAAVETNELPRESDVLPEVNDVVLMKDGVASVE